MNHEILVFVLLAVGLGLIFAELFVPSGGIIAILSLACLGGSIYFAWQTWHETSPRHWWIFLGSVIFLIPATIVGAFQLLARTSLGDGILLSAPKEEDVIPFSREQEHLMSLIGQQGTALNRMTPGGLVKVGDERLHAVSDGMVIESGKAVEIIAVRSQRVVVRELEERSDSHGLLGRETGDADPDAFGNDLQS
ncbi:NfeD family protein [Planctomicrobium sp. SH664]|uniref:NfeD family protein n=1 Tax=Planctomicrobium sp. SH664 TaxID=3448125 RepID=UPI003F5B5FDB